MTPAAAGADVAILSDLEGTLYGPQGAHPGAAETIAWARARTRGIRFLTNRDSVSPAVIARELRDRGLDVDAAEILTPLSVAEGALRGRSTLALVPEALRDGFEEVGPIDSVLVGDVREFLDYGILDRAFRALDGGAELFALQRGAFFLRADGRHLDSGAIVAALEHATGLEARVFGKPSPALFVAAAADLDTPIERCIVVGDDWTTDVAGATAAGAIPVAVRTGKSAGITSPPAGYEGVAVLDGIAQLRAFVEARE